MGRTRRNRGLVVLAAVLISLLAAACSGTLTASPTPSLCAGVPAEMGGCSDERPVFTGSTCTEIGHEWGRAVDRRVLAVIAGPPTEDGKQRSARISDVLVLSSVVAGMRLDELELLPSCDVPEFLSAGQSQFSQQLQDTIGEVLFDGSPIATAEDWEVFLTRFVRIIDEGE